MQHADTSSAPHPARVPWTGPFQLPTIARLNSRIAPDVLPLQVANHWIKNLSTALESPQSSIAPLFLDDGFWRDLLALSWDFRSIHGAQDISDFLSARLAPSGFRALTLAEDSLRAPAIREPFPDIELLQFCFDFETSIGKGTGVCNLANKDGEWKAYTMFTSLTSLARFPERAGALRDEIMLQGTWAEKRARETELIDGNPRVVVIGAGHTGLETAARLKALGVRTLVVEANCRIGDNWRNRYKTLSLHDNVWYDQMVYMPFPATWPVFAPAAKLGDWLESYAHTLELDVWTSARAQSATWDSQRKTWTVRIDRGGQTCELTAAHIVFATGSGGGVPRVPSIPGQELFQGTVLHSSQFTSAEDFPGKKIVVIGACNSAHDIAHDFANHGADVTMFQRSPTFVISAKAINNLFGMLYNENNPTAFADHVTASMPNAVMRQFHQRVFPHIASTADKDLLEGLKKVGFKATLGPDNAGLIPLYYGRGGGYYMDTGASQAIIDGKIKLKTGDGVAAFTQTCVRFSDGEEIRADVVIYATGYGDHRDVAKDVCGPEVHARLKPVWGLDDEGEIRSIWRESGQEGLWFASGNMFLSRYFSSFLAIRIKAEEEGLVRKDWVKRS